MLVKNRVQYLSKLTIPISRMRWIARKSFCETFAWLLSSFKDYIFGTTLLFDASLLLVESHPYLYLNSSAISLLLLPIRTPSVRPCKPAQHSAHYIIYSTISHSSSASAVERGQCSGGLFTSDGVFWSAFSCLSPSLFCVRSSERLCFPESARDLAASIVIFVNPNLIVSPVWLRSLGCQ